MCDDTEDIEALNCAEREVTRLNVALAVETATRMN
jgi:hypothetical protein